jgi:Arc/MetJ family transcription regulator
MPPTNVDLDETLVDQALRATGLRTKKAVVEEGLRALIRLHEQQDVRRLRGMMQWEDPEPQPAAPTTKKTAKKGKGGADPR